MLHIYVTDTHLRLPYVIIIIWFLELKKHPKCDGEGKKIQVMLEI